LDKGNQKDYFVVESVLKGNYLIKTNWRKDLHEYYSTFKVRSTPAHSIASGGGLNTNDIQPPNIEALI
jgi:hypothetical protein